ncbi:MAG: PIN domain-containing protein [SAR324 cluster bacterium]|uniref:PIN domain-containing protein n=1 Tax=SAR324 cluster bacterium TaxID=2024889 RepID=A0A7X9IME8_9DELT|nr:PIN domain-containing protein [SAR324 cluster bacterium]
MKTRVLIDTGPIVALLSSRDQYHELCLNVMKDIVPPMITSWPVLTEASWLLRKNKKAIDGIFSAINGGLLLILDLDDKAPAWIHNFLKRYNDIGALPADASITYLAERENLDYVFTLDKKNFSTYRLSKKRALKLLPLN